MKSISAFGDSIMRGVVLDQDNSNSSTTHYKISTNNFSDKCRNLLGIQINNYAKFGSKINQVVKYVDRYENDIRKSDYVIFECGGNDCDYNWKEISDNPEIEHSPNTAINEFVKYYTSIVNKIKSLSSTPVLLSLPAIDSSRFFNHISRGLNKDNILRWMKGNINYISNWHEIYNIELFKMAYDYNVPIIDITTPFLKTIDFCDYLCADGMHPNDKGQELIAATIKDYVIDRFHTLSNWNK